ncbi:MAG: rhomboid family intramembrane serine protease [Candidatus Zhuqueibacterota bacterium]
MAPAKTKHAIVCPNCGKLISADAEECIHCGIKNPGRPGLFTFAQKIFSRSLDFVDIITYFCVGLYVIALLIDLPGALSPRGGILNFLSPSSKSLIILGMTGKWFMELGRYWTLITAIYLHGGVLHILFNMLWIRQLGPMVEDIFGTSRFILIFTISGVAGFILSTAFLSNPTIGASGSIFGLLGALIYYGRARGGVFGQIVYPQLLNWAVVMFLFGFFFPAVNNLAHLGGFIGGYAAGHILSYQERSWENSNHKRLATIAIGLTVLAFVIVIITIPRSLDLYYRYVSH